MDRFVVLIVTGVSELANSVSTELVWQPRIQAILSEQFGAHAPKLGGVCYSISPP